MSRWNDVITLLAAPEKYQDDAGSWHEGERVGRQVFCNPGIIGIMTMAQLRSSEARTENTRQPVDIGLTDASMVYVRTVDYEGEDACIYRGKEMDITIVTSDGENTKLVLHRNLGND